MRILRIVTAFVMIACVLESAGSAQQTEADDAPVMRALDAFIDGWNSRDARQFAAALHFPHVVFEGGTPRVTEDEKTFVARGTDLWASVQPNWARSVWEERRIVQRLPDVVHVAGRWARLDKAGQVIGRADVLYVVARKDGRWAIAARSGSRAAQGALRTPGFRR